ncbi:Beta-1,4 N-acetylgalactosaminyltransferase 1 [Phlyctochytrium bullatum]|nr:Beta-1,4 N-acetylgalactosaminyltransferase 1 [Phlyctochytrium bullatum]
MESDQGDGHSRALKREDASAELRRRGGTSDMPPRTDSKFDTDHLPETTRKAGAKAKKSLKSKPTQSPKKKVSFGALGASGEDALDGDGNDELSASAHYTIEEFKRDALAWIKSLSLFIGVVVVYTARFLVTPMLHPVRKGELGPQISVGEAREVWMDKRNDMFDNTLVKDPLRIFLIWTTPPETFTTRNYKVIDSYLYHHPDAQIDILATHLPAEAFSAYTAAGYNLNVIRMNDTYLRALASPSTASIPDDPPCPGAAWLTGPNAKLWQSGRYYYSHVTDFVRFCGLYRHGGVYSDFDALTLNRLDGFGETFIGMDSSGARKPLKLGQADYTIMTEEELRNRVVCGWCLRDGDAYLAPGVMGAAKGHVLVKEALRIGFAGAYDPNVFNAVGPQAVTTAFKKLGGDKNGGEDDIAVTVLEKQVLYPYNYQTSWQVFEPTPEAVVKTDLLIRRSASLHLYGHKTKHLYIHEGSVVNEVMERFSVLVTKEPLLGTSNEERVVQHQVRGPRYLGVRRFIEEVPRVRVVARRGAPSTAVEVTVKHGKIRIATKRDKGIAVEWSTRIWLDTATPAALNRQLSRLVYLSDGSADGRDWIEVRLMNRKDHSGKAAPAPGPAGSVLVIPVYDVNKMVTIMVKTMDRIGKVFTLVESARRQYPNITIIASDDGKNIPPGGEGPRRGFYYLPLPYDVGLSAGRNRMVERIKTEYVLTLDDDFTLSEESAIEELVHALETPDETGKKFDIAAAKNPADEDRFELDFCGIMTVTENRVLSLGPGNFGRHSECYHVDFVPNIFVARTELLREKLRWDELLKLGEHEDFFLRAREMGVRTLTCPGVSFHHDQVPHWLMKTDYDRLRNRVYNFWRLSLRKHNLVKLVSFGRTMMDLILPDRIEELKVAEVLSRSVVLQWKSPALSFKVLQSSNKGLSWAPVNYGQGENYEPVPILASKEIEGQVRRKDSFNQIAVMGLKPGTEYMFRVHAGNRFDYEQKGVQIDVRTMAARMEQAQNILQNPSFESGLKGYKYENTSYKVHVSSPGLATDNAVQLDITTTGYLRSRPTVAYLSQLVSASVLQRKLKNGGNNNGYLLTFLAHSRLGKFFDNHPSWRAEFAVWLEESWAVTRRVCAAQPGNAPVELVQKPHSKLVEEFDRSNGEWQSRLMSVCLSQSARVERAEVRGVMESFRGYVTFDDLVLVVTPPPKDA